MARTIIVAFRMSTAGSAPGPEPNYLERARSLCARGEALGGRLVSWGTVLVAIAFAEGSIEDAVRLASSERDHGVPPERAWSGAIAEGEIEPLGPDGRHGELAWGPALVSAELLAGVARPGEVLIDATVSALKAGRLAVVEERSGTGPGARTGGARLELEHPWKVAAPLAPRSGRLADRIRKLARGDESGATAEALARLRRARMRAEGGPPAGRCQAALALGMMLSIAGRPEEALLEALDGLARAREARDPKAIGACMALLAKLYSGAGLAEAASALRDRAV